MDTTLFSKKADAMITDKHSKAYVNISSIFIQSEYSRYIRYQQLNKICLIIIIIIFENTFRIKIKNSKLVCSLKIKHYSLKQGFKGLLDRF